MGGDSGIPLQGFAVTCKVADENWRVIVKEQFFHIIGR
jgi:hypothetical protein